jgi:hypothetical protein
VNKKLTLYHNECGRGRYIGTYDNWQTRDVVVKELALPQLEEELAAITKQYKALVAVRPR